MFWGLRGLVWEISGIGCLAEFFSWREALADVLWMDGWY